MDRRTLMTNAAALLTPASAVLPALPDNANEVMELATTAYEPILKKGDYIITRPGTANLNDRVIVCQKRGNSLLATLVHQSATAITIRPLTPGARLATLEAKAVKSMARVIAIYNP